MSVSQEHHVLSNSNACTFDKVSKEAELAARRPRELRGCKSQRQTVAITQDAHDYNCAPNACDIKLFIYLARATHAILNYLSIWLK